MTARGARRVLLVLLALAMSSVAFAQFGFGFREPFPPLPNIPYDGRFTFVRVRYDPAPAASGRAGVHPGSTAIRSPRRI